MTIKEAMQLTDAQFWLEVSRAITPGPWEHDLSIAPNQCCRCKSLRLQCDGDGHLRYPERFTAKFKQPCPIPPPLKDSPEVLAFRLRDQALPLPRDHCSIPLLPHRVREVYCMLRGIPFSVTVAHAESDRWFGYAATPREQVACCLVALGLWEVTL